MSSDFFFSILRVTTAQIFRSAGVDRCSPSLLDTITDLFIRHLDLLSRTASRNASLAGRIDVTLQDVSMAMENVGLIKPYSLLEEDDYDSLTDDGFDLFIQWATGPVPEEARRVAGLANASKATGADNEGSSNDTEWLTSLVKKHAKIDHELKLKGTLLADPNFDGDLVHKIAGGPSTIFEDEPVQTSYLDLLEFQVNELEKRNEKENGYGHSEEHQDPADSSMSQKVAVNEENESKSENDNGESVASENGKNENDKGDNDKSENSKSESDLNAIEPTEPTEPADPTEPTESTASAESVDLGNNEESAENIPGVQSETDSGNDAKETSAEPKEVSNQAALPDVDNEDEDAHMSDANEEAE